MTNLHDVLEKARAARQRLPPNEAAVLFAAAVRLAAAQGGTLRTRLLQIDEVGALHLLPYDENAPELDPGYLAPELKGADAPRKSEPRVQVYAAGALGYELLTGHLPPGNPAELSGPLGDIVRMAMAADRRERFADLGQLQEAVEAVRPRPPAEGERNIFSAIRNRWARAAMPVEKEAVARLIEKLKDLEGQVGQLAKAQGKLEAAQRDGAERLDRFEDGQQRLRKPPPSPFGPALLGAVLAAAAVVAAGWAFGYLPRPAAAPTPSAQTAPSPAATPAPAAEPAAPDASIAEDKAAKDSGAEASTATPDTADAGAAAAEEAPDAAAAEAAPPDAGAIARVPAPPAPAPKKGRKGKADVNEAAMQHAVAVSQVRRGETALGQNNPAEALDAFKAALDNEANLPAAFRGMGMAYAMQGKDAQALKSYEKYLKLSPSAPDKADIQRAIEELKARTKAEGGAK